MQEFPPAVSVQEFAQIFNENKGDILLLDVRNPDEFAYAKIEGGQLLPLPELADRVSEPRRVGKKTSLLSLSPRDALGSRANVSLAKWF